MSEIKNWTIPVENTIHVPDELDGLVNQIGFQYRLHTISKRTTEPEFVCKVVYLCQKHFLSDNTALRTRIEELEKANDTLREVLEQAETHLTIPLEPSVALHWVREAIKLSQGR